MKSAINGKTALLTIIRLLGLVALLMLVGCAGAFGPTVNGGVDFNMSTSPGSQSVVAGHGASFNVTVSPPAMIGFVNLSVIGLPSGVEAAFTPGFEIDGSRRLNVFTTTTTPPSTSQLTITASDSSGSRSATATLVITPAADFTMSVTPDLQTVKPGGSADYVVKVTFAGNATGPVNLRVVGMPSGVSASFDHSTFTASGTAILTLTAGPDIVSVIAPMDVIGTDSSGTITVPFAFSIIPADFYLAQGVGPVEVNAGGTVTGQVLVVGLFATPGTVTLSASGLPAGITASFSPTTITGGGVSTITIATEGATVPGDYNLTINGVDASGRNLTTIPFTVVPGNAGAGFFLSAAPLSEEINAGQSAFFNINVSAPNGEIPPLTFQVSGLQDGVTAEVAPISNTPGAFGLGISTSSFLETTAVMPTVTAFGPNGTQSISVYVLIDIAP